MLQPVTSSKGCSERPFVPHFSYSKPKNANHSAKAAALRPGAALPHQKNATPRSLQQRIVKSAASATDISSPASPQEQEVWPGVFQGFWTWQGHTIRYLRASSSKISAAGPPILCIHGFGGNADHWRKNLPALAAAGKTAYAIDLLGYGFSSKPSPVDAPVNSIYCFENWSRQILDFIGEVIGEPALLTCNSVGGIAGLQAAIDDPSQVQAVQVMNISLRMLHVTKQSPWARPLVSALQTMLRTTPLGRTFFSQVATREGVRSVLRQCYANPAAVDDELVDVILKPGLEPGAVDVFLDFISYSGGPLPEELMRASPVPVSVLWGEKDPWEKIEWGREFSSYPMVEEFVSLPGVGHCPQDEAPHLVNPLILEWVARHSGARAESAM